MERSDIRGQKEGVVQGRDWIEVTLEDRRRVLFKEDIREKWSSSRKSLGEATLEDRRRE